jgi:hypothetical protein
MTRRFSQIAAGLLVVCLAAQVALLVKYRRDQRYLLRILDGLVSAGAPASEQAKSALLIFKNRSDRENDSYFLLSIFAPLRATPAEVAVDGGDCADRCRLLITMLRLRGIRASKWALYSRDGHPKHAVVEAQVETGRMVLDPLFHLWFPRPTGGYYGMEDLRRDPDILRSRIAGLLPEGSTPYGDPIQGYPVDEYSYDHPRTLNWNKSFVFTTVYQFLHGLLGERVDTIPRPSFVEQPALVLVVLIGMLEFAILAALLAVRRSPRARTTANQSQRTGDAVATLDDGQRRYLGALADAALAADAPPDSGESWQDLIFALAGEAGLPNGRAFAALYAAFLGRSNGPRAGWLLASLEPSFVTARLRASASLEGGTAGLGGAA